MPSHFVANFSYTFFCPVKAFMPYNAENPQPGDAILDDDNVIRLWSRGENYFDLNGIKTHEQLLRAIVIASKQPCFETWMVAAIVELTLPVLTAANCAATSH
jgi:hypothetical protein